MARFASIPTKGKRHSPIYEFKWETIANSIQRGNCFYGRLRIYFELVNGRGTSFDEFSAAVIAITWKILRFTNMKLDWTRYFVYLFVLWIETIGVYKFQWKERYKKFLFVKYERYKNHDFRELRTLFYIFPILDSQNNYPSLTKFE